MSKKVGDGRVEAVRKDALAIPALTALRGELSDLSLSLLTIDLMSNE